MSVSQKVASLGALLVVLDEVCKGTLVTPGLLYIGACAHAVQDAHASGCAHTYNKLSSIVICRRMMRTACWRGRRRMA